MVKIRYSVIVSSLADGRAAHLVEGPSRILKEKDVPAEVLEAAARMPYGGRLVVPLADTPPINGGARRTYCWEAEVPTQSRRVTLVDEHLRREDVPMAVRLYFTGNTAVERELVTVARECRRPETDSTPRCTHYQFCEHCVEVTTTWRHVPEQAEDKLSRAIEALQEQIDHLAKLEREVHQARLAATSGD